MRFLVETRFGVLGGYAVMRYMEKQRKYKRRNRRQPVAVCAWLEFDSDRTTRGMVSVDLGPEGAQFCALNAVNLGERVLVRLQLESTGRPMECKGRVCWTQSKPNSLQHFGIRFLDLHEDEQARLCDFLGGAYDPSAIAVG